MILTAICSLSLIQGCSFGVTSTSKSSESSVNNESSVESSSIDSSINENPSSSESLPSSSISSTSSSEEVTSDTPSSSTTASSVSSSITNSSSQTSSVSSSSSSAASSSSSAESIKELKTYKSKCNEAYLEWDAITSATSYNVYSKDSESTSYSLVDSELVLGTKAYVKGLSKGNASFKVVPVINSVEDTSKQIEATKEVLDTDREGYASFNYSSYGTGAYKSNGQLKDNAVVIYVDDSNKNTVTYSSYTGLVKIIQNQYKFNKPLDIRVKGRIASNIFNKKTFTPSSSGEDPSARDSADYENTFETTYTNLNNLRFKFFGSAASDLKTYYTNLNTGFTFDYSAKTSYKDTDSYFSMCDVTTCSNITVEGVGDDAEIYQWGFTFSKCNNIEVKNLTFTNYQEDACSFQGDSNSTINDYRNFFVHNCVFNKGLNNFDLSQEQDKGDGDGSTDIKYLRGVTFSYNTYNLTHKTGLVGGGGSHLTMDVSFHHNFYNQDKARLPLGRQVNLHSYNNYFYKCSACYQMRSNSFTLSESNYFDSCTKTAEVKAEDSYSAGVIKSYLNKFVSCTSDAMTVVTARDETVSNSCKPDGSTDYSSFDTDSSLFYYDSTKNVTDADNLIEASLVKDYVTSNSGLLY